MLRFPKRLDDREGYENSEKNTAEVVRAYRFIGSNED